ncbi:hypothetical protein VSDG_09735 [Cytospora chrysosperma]|uniref:Uncharacterized protein n=1 Tax=Cytospora chrysosperma TaxID=252740 RepID=A0A423VA82_CYTCH|nr:hypothetical protein VSDG_09735 [Valsa sordida]
MQQPSRKMNSMERPNSALTCANKRQRYGCIILIFGGLPICAPLASILTGTFQLMVPNTKFPIRAITFKKHLRILVAVLVAVLGCVAFAPTNIWTIYASGSADMESRIFVGVDGQQTAMGPRVFMITSITSANARMGDLAARDGRGRQRHETA